jgi:hypothetical protein
VAEVTVIAPNVVEFVGNFARQGTLNAERVATPPPQPPPKPDQPLRTHNDAGGQSRQLSANQNAPANARAATAEPRTTSPGGFNLTGNQRSRPTLTSTQFLAQQIAQESGNFARVSASFASAASAYDKSEAGRARATGEPTFITRSINRSI